MGGYHQPGFDRLPAPSSTQMQEVAAISGFETFVLAPGVVSAKPSGGGFVFQIRRRRTHLMQARVAEPAGVHLFDYFADPDGVFSGNLTWFHLWRRTRGLGLDALIVGPMIETAPKLMGFTHRWTTAIFNADFATNGWANIHGKKKLRQLARNAEKHFPVTFETCTEAAIIPHLPKLAALHKERWRFEGIGSAFMDVSRLDQYQSPAAVAVLHILLFGDEIAAMHYGFRWHDGVLFHTPVINIKFLKLSPLTVLIDRIARWADEEQLKVFDFGQGSEEYKSRFANAEREAFSVLVPLTPTGLLIGAIGALGRHDSVRGFVTRVGEIKQGYVRWKRHLFERVHCYQWTPPGTAAAQPIPEQAKLNTLDTWEAFVDHARTLGQAIEGEHFRRFRAGWVYLCLYIQGGIACTAWISNPVSNPQDAGSATVEGIKGHRMLWDIQETPTGVGTSSLKLLLALLSTRWPQDRYAIRSSGIDPAFAQQLLAAGFQACGG